MGQNLLDADSALVKEADVFLSNLPEDERIAILSESAKQVLNALPPAVSDRIIGEYLIARDEPSPTNT